MNEQRSAGRVGKAKTSARAYPMAFVDSFSHPRPAVPRARPRRQQVENLPYVRGAGIIGTWQHNPADDRITAGWLRSMGVPSVRVFCADHNCSHSVSVGTPHAVGWHEIPGFSDADPWLPLAKYSREENVESLRRDNGSLYWLYRRLLNFGANTLLSQRAGTGL